MNTERLNTARGQRDYFSKAARILLVFWFKYGRKQTPFIDLRADCERKWSVLRAENGRVKKRKSTETGDFAGINSSNCSLPREQNFPREGKIAA